jgi:hypothetical protein
MTPEQKKLARHALGLGGRQKRSYRNRFVTGAGSSDYPAWVQMEANGLAWRRAGSQLTGGDDLFGLTVTGARAALNPGERLCAEDFPSNAK